MTPVRLILSAALALVVAAAVLLLTGSSYVVHARFLNAGQLVTGGQVQVAGRTIGSIESITLAPDGQADVALGISDASYVPLHEGTQAAIRAVGQAGIANRYVNLTPGPTIAPAIANGGAVPVTDTTGIVELDSLFDWLNPSTRADVQQLLANSSQVFAGSGSRYFNAMLGKLDPAADELNVMLGQLAEDRSALGALVRTASTAAGAIASRQADLQSSVQNAADAFGQIASERRALSDLLVRAPSVLHQADGTLTKVASTVQAIRPTLRLVPAAAGALSPLLRHTTATLGQATPVLTRLNRNLPPLTHTLSELGPLIGPAESALSATTSGVRAALPIASGLRTYGSDFFLGLFNGLAGLSGGTFQGAGHYLHVEFVQNEQNLLESPLSPILSTHPLVPSLFNYRTRLYRPCPGGQVPPAADGSTPWIPDPALCTPADDLPASVNTP
jgi:phospholipid/cholesterol/gamma-HCH transport system substrate-binding protein